MVIEISLSVGVRREGRRGEERGERRENKGKVIEGGGHYGAPS